MYKVLGLIPCTTKKKIEDFIRFFFYFFAVLGLELRAYTLSHSTSPFLWRFFSKEGLLNYLPGWALNNDPSDLCLLSS
jgi:hypothetical protein